MSPSISVIVMTFNEKDSLGNVVKEINGSLSRTGLSNEVILVDDGSTDGSSLLAEKLAKENPNIKVIHHGVNKGLGGVYRTGFANAKNDFITFFPADGQFPAVIIEQFVPLMKNMDMVLGYLPDRKSSLLAKFLSWIERMLFSLLFGKMPRFQGILMFRREMLKDIELKSQGRGWAVLMEFIIRSKKNGAKMISVPTLFRPREYGRSKVNNIHTILANLKQALALKRYL
jgi:glycosyltransferase involved in cell wall biosynthesis